MTIVKNIARKHGKAERKKHRFFYGYVVVSASFFILLLFGGTIYSFGVFFKPLLAEFGWTRAAISGAFSLYMLLHGVLYIFTGRLNDKFGPRILLTVCGFFMGLGFLLMSRLTTLWQLYLFYGVIIAMGMSGVSVPLLSTIAKWFIKRRGLMTGIALAGIGVGTVVIPPVASHLILSYNWRTSYLIIGSIALVLIVVAAQFLRRDPLQVGQLPYGQGETKQGNLTPEANEFPFHGAIRTKQLWILGILMFCFGFAEQAIFVHIVPHVTDLGIPALVAANILAIIGGLSTIGRIGVGGAADRIGNKVCLIVSFIILSFSLLWLLVAKELWMFYLFAAFFGFGYGAVITVISPVVAELFGLRAHGAILGVVIFIQLIGSAIGPVLTGRLFDVTTSYQSGFLFSAGLSIAGLVLAVVLRAQGRPKESPEATS